MQLPNRTIFCHDNLEVLQGIDSNTIDLIYLDPPFNKQKVFTAPIGSSGEGARFRDWFREEDIKDEWILSIKEDYDGLHKFLSSVRELSSLEAKEGSKHYLYNYCYLVYMAMRLLEMRRILKETGSIYLHCDPTMSHYLKILLDIIFGEKNFRNEIVWKRHSSGQKGSQYDPKKWGANTDHIFFYVKDKDTRVFPYIPFTQAEIDKKFKYKDEKGELYQLVPIAMGKNKGERPNLHYKFKGISPPPYPNAWSLSKARMQEEYEKGNIVIKNNKLERRKYLKDSKGKAIGSGWNDIKPSAGKEYVNYPTQKPLALLERIIKASSNEGDFVLDPFCGCATTCIAAEKLNRKWIGIDVSVKAYELVKKRLQREVADPKNLFQYDNQINFSVTPPKRTDKNVDEVEQKYIYIISHPKYPGEYKVGIAKNCDQRVSNYQTSDPDRKYKLEYSLRTPLFRTIEKHIHTKFENKHEWVRAKLEDIIFEIENYNQT